MSEKEFREMESIEIRNGFKVKHLLGKCNQELESKFWRYVRKNSKTNNGKGINISLLICRRKRYSVGG